MNRIFLGLLVVIVIASGVGYALGWFGEAAQVAQEQYGPRASLQKYEWFVDQASRIEKMDKDVQLYEDRVARVDAQYVGYGQDKTKWPPDVRVQYNHARQQASDDLVAVVSQRNNLVREYNAASEKFNWSPFQTRPDKPHERYFEPTTNPEQSR